MALSSNVHVLVSVLQLMQALHCSCASIFVSVTVRSDSVKCYDALFLGIGILLETGQVLCTDA